MRTGKQRIAFDIDGVLADSGRQMIQTLNALKNTNFTMNDTDSWEWFQNNFGKDYFYFVYNKTWKNYGSIKPLVQQDKMIELSKLYDVDLVTARPWDTVPDLAKWLSTHFPKLDAGLVVLIVTTDKADKPYDIYVDDHPYLAESIESKDGKILYLVRYKYNQHIQKSGKVIPVNSVDTVVQKLITTAKQKTEKKHSF